MKKLLFVFLLLIFFSLSGCTNSNDALEQLEFNETCGNEYQSKSDSDKSDKTKEKDQKSDFETITANEAKEIMDNNPHAVILDVRTKEEYDELHIPDSILIPNEDISEETISSLNLTNDSILLIYCRSGNRSKDASSKLVKLGYQNVYDFGGIKDWPYETESESD